MKKLLLILVMFFCTLQFSFSQEDGVVSLAISVRSSLKFNRYLINPTFSFVREQNTYINITNKREWTQFEDAPTTYLFNYSGRYRENIGVGVGLFQQNYGVLTTFGGVINFAYNAQLQTDSNLTFGLNLGVYKSGINDGKVIVNQLDPSLDNIPNNMVLTVSPGINYGLVFFDFGLSVNNLVQYNIKSSEVLKDDPQQSIQAHLVYTGYVSSRGFFDESKFTTLIRSEFKKDQTIFSGIAMLNVPKGIWAQAGYNTVYGLTGGLGINVTKQISVEYNYEKAVGDLTTFGPSHEFTIAYKFESRERFYYSGDDREEALLMKDTKRKPAISTKPKMSAEERALVTAQRAAEKAEAQERARLAAEERAQARKAAQEEARLAAEEKAAAKTTTKLENQTEIAAEAAAQAQAEEAARLAAEAAARAQADEEARLAAEAAARAQADEEARLAAEAAAQAQAEEAARLAAEAAARAQADEEARLAAEAAARAQADEEARLAAEAAAQAQAEEAARLAAEAAARAQADEEARLAAEAAARAQADEEARLAAEAAAQAQADEAARLAAEAAAQAQAEEAARLAAEAAARAQADEEARLAAEAAAQAQAEAAAQAQAEEAARLAAEAAAQAQAEEEARLAAEAAAQAQAEEAARLAAEAAAQAQAEEAARLAAEAAAQAQAEEAARLAAEAAAQAQAEEAARLAAEAAAQAQAEEAARVAAEAAAQAQAEEEARLAAEAAAQAQAEEEARLAAETAAQAQAEEAARLAAQAQAEEEARLAAEAAAQAQAEEAARLAAEAAAQAQVENAEPDAQITQKDDLAKSMYSLTETTKESKLVQEELLSRLDDAIAIKDQDLKDLRKENDLSEQGIYLEPKPFKSITAENRVLAALQADLDRAMAQRNKTIKELENLYIQRIQKGSNKNDATSKYYLETIQKIRTEQEQSEKAKARLVSTLETINVQTEIERRRRIKRAQYDNEKDRFLKDKASLERIIANTPLSATPLTPDDFDFGDRQSGNVQILKGVQNVEAGFYMIIAVHENIKDRDTFLEKVVSTGQSNVNFFFDVNSSKYFIYYEKFDSVEEAMNKLQLKGDKPYNGQMSVVKIEN